MIHLLPAIVAIVAIACGIAHSWLSERRLLPHVQSPMMRLIRVLVHLPSFAWAFAGIGLLAADLRSDGPVTAWSAAALFAVSAVGNRIGVGRLHVGSVLLGAAAIGSAVVAVR